MKTFIIKYGKYLIVGIDMKKWQPNFMHLKTHLIKSYTWEKPTEMHF